MNSEQRARELLAEELRGLGLHEDAYPVAVGAELVGVLDAALRAIARALEQPESRAITALKVTLFGVECYLPASIAQAVQERCDESALEQREGFVMVPVEPTPKMLDATWNDPAEAANGGGIESHNTRNRRIYLAMLAAAQPSDNKEADRG